MRGLEYHIQEAQNGYILVATRGEEIQMTLVFQSKKGLIEELERALLDVGE